MSQQKLENLTVHEAIDAMQHAMVAMQHAVNALSDRYRV